MNNENFILLTSLFSIILSITYLLLINYIFKINLIDLKDQNIYLNRNKLYICENINDKNTCKSVLNNNNMIDLNNDNLFINKNTLLCDDINDVNTCSCLSNKCDFFQNLNHITLVDKTISFDDNKYGMKLGARILPMESKNTFTFSTWINITTTDSENWRSIFLWRKSNNNYNPAILVSPKNWSTCGTKIDIRFNSLNTNDGTFNIVDDNHGHCIRDTIYNYYNWFNLVIVGNNNKLSYYINSTLLQEENLYKNLELGDENDQIFIGGSPEYSCDGILLSKMRWFSKPLSLKEITILFNDKYY